MADRLAEKTERYERLLADACGAATISVEAETRLGRLAAEHIEMAEAYLDDGRHFLADEDPVNALAAFSYGHGWLDAAIRGGLVSGAGEREEGPPT